MNRMNPKVDFYFNKAKKWQEEIAILRVIVLDCGLTEELRWGVPCYTFQKTNIVLMSRVQRVLCAFVFQRRLVKRCQQSSNPTDEECAGGAPDSVH